MTKITIKKAKLKSGLFLTVEFNEYTDTGSNKVTKSCTAPVHTDLTDAFKELNEHLSALCEQHDKKGKPAICRCTGFAIGGSLDGEGVTLTGTRELTDERIVHLTSPFTKWSNDDYKNLTVLEAAVENCITEVNEYLAGKIRPEAQTSLEFHEQETEEIG